MTVKSTHLRLRSIP